MQAPLMFHLLATMALYYQLMCWIRPRTVGALAYALAFLLWWGGLFVMGIAVGAGLQ